MENTSSRLLNSIHKKHVNDDFLIGLHLTQNNLSVSAFKRDGFEFLSEDDITQHNGSDSL